MSTDPHTLDAVLAHRAALLSVVDGLRVRAEAAEREVERLAGLLGRYGRGILGCAASGCEGCMVCDPEKVVERLTAELDAWHDLAHEIGPADLDPDEDDNAKLVEVVREVDGFHRRVEVRLRAEAKIAEDLVTWLQDRLTAERDSAYARGVEDERRAVVVDLDRMRWNLAALRIGAGLHVRQGGDRG